MSEIDPNMVALQQKIEETAAQKKLILDQIRALQGQAKALQDQIDQLENERRLARLRDQHPDLVIEARSA